MDDTSYQQRKDALAWILPHYAVPDPAIVGTLSKGGQQLSFVGHAEITRILIEVDPMWWWEPAAFIDGVPAIHVHNGLIPRKGQDPLAVQMASMWGTLYIHGASRVAVGSCEYHKPDLHKELVSDFLRNAAMRFGIALNLWSKQEWDDLKTEAHKPAIKPAPAPTEFLSQEQIDKFTAYCTQRGLNPVSVYKEAGVEFGKAKQSDVAALKDAVTRLQTPVEGDK